MPNPRSWILRHLARRLPLGKDALRHLSTFQRLGEHLETAPPNEMLPVGARTVIRAVRSRAASQIRPDWVWPYWLERQLDPRSSAFVPRGMLAVAHNLTHRNWTAVGNRWSPWEAIVDPRGLVTPWYDGWSCDWWVRDDDGRWWFPSRCENVTQRLVGPAPVIETELPLGDGAVVQHVAAQVLDGEEYVTVELHNRSRRHRRVAVALRPANPEGLAVVERLELVDQRLLADGALALLLPHAPVRSSLSTYLEGDVAQRIATGPDRHERRTVHDRAGLAQAAMVYDLEAGEVLTVAVSLLPAVEQLDRRAGPDLRAADPALVTRLRPADEVADAWKPSLARGMRVDVPDARLQEAVDVNRAYLQVLHDPGDITPGPYTYHRFWFRDAAYLLAALDRWGLHDEAADVIAHFPGRQRADGFYYSQWREWDANGSAIWAVAEHHRLTGDRELVDRLWPSVERGARWIARHRRSRRHDDEIVRGLLPPGISAEHLGPHDYYYWDNFWSVRGLRDAAELGRVVGRHEVARRFDATAAALQRDLWVSIRLAASRLGVTAIPAGPRRGLDPGMVGSLVACEPLRILAADDPYVEGTLTTIRDRFTLGSAFYQGISHTGLGTYLTLQVAFCELERNDPRAWERLRWLLESATPTHTWPEALHPQLGTGCMGDGHHGWALADFLSFVRAVLVREARWGGLELLGVLPPEWRGRPLSVRDAPTAYGRVSYEVSWEGEQPRLRWHCERPGIRLRAPGLSPDWQTTDAEGEALLDASVPDRGGSP